MHSPPLYTAYELLKEEKQITDEDMLESLNKGASCSMNELNKVLMQLEILGLANIRSVGKDKRRIEFVEAPAEDTRSSAGAEHSD